MEDAAMNTTLPLGAHLVTPRTGYRHHGIYVGQGRVVHYAGYGRVLRRGPVETVSLETFTNGADFWVEARGASPYSSEEIVARAFARLGENRYSVMRNNCEHLCSWCIAGEARSSQVEAVCAAPGRAARAAAAALGGWLRGCAEAVLAPLAPRRALVRV
jgi:hypothetical protein